jgi:hypothetical protein
LSQGSDHRRISKDLTKQRHCRPLEDPAAPQSNPTPQSLCLLQSLSAFCRAAIAKKLQRHLLQEIIEAAMLQDLQKTHKQFRNLEALVPGLIRQEYGKKK